MKMTFKDALDNALKTTGRTLRSVAMASNVSYEQLKSLKQGKAQGTNADDAMRVAEVFGVTLEDFCSGNLGNARLVAVAGRVGAGAEVDLFDAFEKGDGHYHVICPPQIAPQGVVAVEVAGNSMSPTYEPGTVLFYSRDTIGVPTEAIGRICVCEDIQGRAWVKQVKVGREDGTYSLLSVNPETQNMHGMRLKWAAPVRFSLPPEFVERVE